MSIPDRLVTATATRLADPTRWVRLSLALRGEGDAPTTPLLAVEALDDLAAGYELENWKSGLLSGYFWVCRKAGRIPPPPISISELAGALASGDMHGVVRAAEAAAAELFDVPLPPASVEAAEWAVSVTVDTPVSR